MFGVFFKQEAGYGDASLWRGSGEGRRGRPGWPPTGLTKTQQEAESWDAWSWWDESGALTQALLDRGLRAGPDVTWSQGWDPGTSEHASRLLDCQARFKPKIIFFTPNTRFWKILSDGSLGLGEVRPSS